MSDVSAVLLAGACLIESAQTPSQSTLKSALLSRLANYHDRLGTALTVNESNTLDEVQLRTAEESLRVVERVQSIIGVDTTDSENPVPLIGTRDLAQLRTLLSIVFRWGTEPLLSSVLSSLPSTRPSANVGPKIVDLTDSPAAFTSLSKLVTQLLSLLFPSGLQGRLPQTLITAALLDRHATDILKPCICLGWLPKSLASDSIQPLDVVRPLGMRLLATLPPSQTIVALGNVMSTVSSPQYIRRTCASLLSRQLMRPEGVRGLCAAVFGEGDASSDHAELEKLDHVARVLSTVPSGMQSKEYFATTIPRVIKLLSDASSAYKRASAFAISRMLATDGKDAHREIASAIILRTFHKPFTTVADETSATSTDLDATTSLSTLMTLITNTDPSPDLISALLSPIIPPLYALLHHLDHVRTADPTLKESVRGLLSTWARVVISEEGVTQLWSILEGEEIEFSVGLDGEIRRLAKSKAPPTLSLFTPEDLNRAEESGEFDPSANILNLYPDPGHFVGFLKSVGREDISSHLFVRLLEAYRDQKQDSENDPKRTLLYLQLVIQMQTQLADAGSSSNILKKPEHILTFVKHALESAGSPPPRHKEADQVDDFVAKLRISDPPEIADAADEDGDSDDDMPDSERFTADDEMTETSVNLLLSILEANEDLSARTAPVLNEIFSLLEPLALNGPTSIRPLAREARMVMTARLASTSTAGSSKSRDTEEEDMQQTYQKALKLLQDPILPVRAHGLLLLRQLVTTSPSKSSAKAKSLDPALVPAILSIFLQSVQDDDSYIFLNAVQGLAAMVGTFGKDVLRGLVRDYSHGLDGNTVTQQDVDTRVRIGEALGLVIRRCGDTLGSYTDIIVPPLFRIVRSSHVPTVLRTSSLSLLADCEQTHALALLPWFSDLSEGMIDLLQIEMVSVKEQPKDKKVVDEENVSSMDSDPASANSKFPPLRRAALHFLSLLIRETTRHAYDSSFGASLLPSASLKRAKITLQYVAATDEDNVARVMAREAGEDLAQLEEAIVGL